VRRLPAGLLALVSLLLPGLGHALARDHRRAWLLAGLALAGQLGYLAVQSAARVTVPLLLLAAAWLVLMLALALFAAFDSWRRARTAEPGGWRGRLGVAAGTIALGAGLALVPGEPLAWRSFYAPSGSMIPSLLVGDRFVVQEGWYEANPLRRGEVAVFTLTPGGAAYVKRVIGLPGDTVQMLRGRLVLNDVPVPVTPGAEGRESWALPDGPVVEVLRIPGAAMGQNTERFVVPPGHVFLMGDNVENSLDSRLDERMRYIPAQSLVGRAAIIYWPWTGGRFGKVIQ
jgi:signal peptidase I